MTKQWQPLTDYQWAAMSPFFDNRRKRRYPLRLIIDAIGWALRCGNQWRNLPPCYPPWQAVYYYFYRWTASGLLKRISDGLNEQDRLRQGQPPRPSVLCIDSQSVKLHPFIHEHRGIDGGKLVNGRKRTFITDRQGRLWGASVTAANMGCGAAGVALLTGLLTPSQGQQPVLASASTFLGDGAYGGVFARAVQARGMVFSRASRPPTASGFVPVAGRWMIERTIGWTNFFRRLVKDYEYTTASATSWLYLANIQLMLQRLNP